MQVSIHRPRPRSSGSRPRVLGLYLALLIPTACGEAAVEVPEDRIGIFKIDPQVPPADTASSPAKIALGRSLYHDARLSREGKVSCATCHSQDTFGVDRKKTSEGTRGQFGNRNAPTSFNAFRQIAQFWDGRAATVEEQAVGPILNPIEHGLNDAAEVVSILKQDPKTEAAFREAFPGAADPVTLDNVGRAIGAFERTLVTTSRFDKFLDGDEDALTNAEKRGLLDFVETGCTTCHYSRAVGGQTFNKLGLVQPYETEDLGRYEHTKQEADKFFFKVPTLLNVAETGPYLHDGSIDELSKVVEIMARHQLGRELESEKIESIVTFLSSLSGELTSPVN